MSALRGTASGCCRLAKVERWEKAVREEQPRGSTTGSRALRRPTTGAGGTGESSNKVMCVRCVPNTAELHSDESKAGDPVKRCTIVRGARGKAEVRGGELDVR